MTARKNPHNYQQPLGPFDRTRCFNFFPSWVEDIRQQSATDPANAVHAFLVLADYCLYGKEPDPENNPWGMAWNTVKSGADCSIKNRSRRYGTGDPGKHDLIVTYCLEHPDATQREISAAVGCSLGLVNKVLQSLTKTDSSGPCSIDYNSHSYSDGYPRVSIVEQNEDEILGPPCPDALDKEAAKHGD